mgnify:CR=1 FL=1
MPVSRGNLKEVAEQSGVLKFVDEFLDPALRLDGVRTYERLIANIQDLEAKDCRDAYVYFKKNNFYILNVNKIFFNIFMIIFRNGFMYKNIAFCEILSINCQSSSSKREIVQMDTPGCSLSIFWVSGMK